MRDELHNVSSLQTILVSVADGAGSVVGRGGEIAENGEGIRSGREGDGHDGGAGGGGASGVGGGRGEVGAGGGEEGFVKGRICGAD